MTGLSQKATVLDEEANPAANTADAIAYIKASSIYSDKKHEWFLPLIEKALEGKLEQEDVASLIFDGDLKKSLTYTAPNPIKKSSTYTVVPQDIRKLTSIESVANVGLVDITTPIKLEEGLNIFYGRNGAGKSSI